MYIYKTIFVKIDSLIASVIYNMIVKNWAIINENILDLNQSK